MATPEPLAAADKLPQVAPEQPVPASDQVTPAFCLSFWTIAVKGWPAFAGTFAFGGVTVTLSGPPDPAATLANPLSTKTSVITRTKRPDRILATRFGMCMWISFSLRQRGGDGSLHPLPRGESMKGELERWLQHFQKGVAAPRKLEADYASGTG